MLGILADADVDLVVVDHRRGDEVVARALAAECIVGRPWGCNRTPDYPCRWPDRTSEPAVAAWEDDLRLAVDDGIGRAGPLAVHQHFALVDELS